MKEETKMQQADGLPGGPDLTRRQFVKGLAMGAATLSLAAILPGCSRAVSQTSEETAATGTEPATTASAADKTPEGGIYIEGGDVNMNGQTYTLEFIQPVKLTAVVDGVTQTEGTWRTSNKHLVSVDPDGTILMRDGVGGYDVEVSWSLGDISYQVMFHTGQTAGGHSLEVDRPMTRGDFMIRLANYFGWYHYNGVMDDGTDIDEAGNILKEERVRNYHDVTGRNDYVKPIECALDMGVLKAESPEDCFYPMSAMTREDAAVILCRAFLMDELEDDYLAAFSDADKISKECYSALNILVGRNFLRGRTNKTINPTDGITDTEARILIESIDKRVAAPVWAMPVSLRKFVRCRPIWFTATEQATVHWRCRAFNISHEAMKGLFIGDRGNGVVLSDEWGEWTDYIPGYSTDPMFGLNNNKDFPYDNVYFCVEVEAYATREGLLDSPVSRFIWRIDRPAWHDFAMDKLHEGTDDYPTVYRFFDNFQAAAYYIEGSKMGILYDGLMPTNTSTSLIDQVRELATKPFVFVLGHNHPDHKGAMASAYRDGLDVYLCDRVGPVDGEWSIEVYAKDYTSGNPVIDSTETGTYSGSTIHAAKEGDVLDLGNCQFEFYQLPGHEDGMLLLYDRKHGLLFSSDIYGVNRYWVADQFAARGVRQDLLLSLHQQLMEEYAKDGGEVKELYTGHNRIGVGADYLMVWEQCLQNLVNYGPDGISDDRRGDGALVAKDGNSFDTLNWTAFAVAGKQVVAEYTGQYDGRTFRRIELDNTGENDTVESNLYFDYRTNAHLSNVTFEDAELVGHDFKYKAGQETENEMLPDGRLKYAIPGKFVPYEYEYDVIVGSLQGTVTLTPVAMSDRIAGMTVNGKNASSRCPVTVSAGSPAVVVITGPDQSTTETYTFRFRTA
ncbi:cadherin-like beta sandwich domain-containing protein [Cuneatibacter sp. NSJ-177]|uniref:cadherin-like beta sandwich domain-containing protein n=1 Tax=Cuneatibacter sp. NSJ-177 TaxID=2931401 RepID=UPI001FD40A31|nr:cadherin-like beta sandwich domain-containing protein [Cuneatibacter sp. NSJ-177]MCJ7834753.1 cadherin-like beta sandwich domain-containing protein [Cuneatibacter sp. NSJ-177]